MIVKNNKVTNRSDRGKALLDVKGAQAARRTRPRLARKAPTGVQPGPDVYISVRSKCSD